MAKEFLDLIGNDTIDPYPLGGGNVEKILCVSERTFGAILKDFKAFFKGNNGLSPRSLNTQPSKGQNARPKAAEQTLSPKLGPTESAAFFRDYEPTNIIYLQHSNIRRWRRVNE